MRLEFTDPDITAQQVEQWLRRLEQVAKLIDVASNRNAMSAQAMGTAATRLSGIVAPMFQEAARTMGQAALAATQMGRAPGYGDR